MEPGKRKRVVLTVLGVFVALVVVAALWLPFYFSEPMGDMRRRADAFQLPSGCVLMSESYDGAVMFGSRPHLRRTYSAPWPGLCDALNGLSDRVGTPEPVVAQPPEYSEQVCNYATSYSPGFGAWIRGWHYRLELVGISPSLGSKGPSRGIGFRVLYPRHDDPEPKIIPPDRAVFGVDVLAYR
jgi:hypothetical protein